MNERIRELMIQSNPHGDFKDCEWIFEKFAELLIRECAFVAQNKDSTNIDLRYGRGLAAGKIFEHFGY
jgi:hypothetical protein